MIELKNIKKYYFMGENVVKALDDVSLTVNDGEFVTIIGPSGSGKSTLMNIIGCLDKATEGQYLVDGVEIDKFKENQLAFLRNKKMGFIFQGFNLLQNLSAYENVELPLIYQGVPISERKNRVIDALNLVGMADRMKHKPGELSGGQQQRVAIARALATKPMLILADEPTGNLDSATGDEIMKILRELNDAGTTVIIITHNDDIAKQSKRVVRIHDGKIESDKTYENFDLGLNSTSTTKKENAKLISVSDDKKQNSGESDDAPQTKKIRKIKGKIETKDVGGSGDNQQNFSESDESSLNFSKSDESSLNFGESGDALQAEVVEIGKEKFSLADNKKPKSKRRASK